MAAGQRSWLDDVRSMEGLGAGFQADRVYAAKSMTMSECATEVQLGQTRPPFAKATNTLLSRSKK